MTRDQTITARVWKALPTEALDALSGVAALRRVEKGEAIFAEGEPAEQVWLVAQGAVYLIKRTPGGGSITLMTVTPAEPLLGVSALEHGRYAASAIAATDGIVVRIPSTDFSEAMDRTPALMKQILLACSRRIRQMAEAISVAQAPVEVRLAHALLRLRSSFGRTVPVTHRELSRMAGTRWETSIRTLSAMKRKGWLASGRGRVTILHPQSLRKLLDHRTPTPRADL
jgi:CRP/FNR family transcriptional regulator